jgi:signal transduction histidine kinase/ActR/RegA family two-component response regulator
MSPLSLQAVKTVSLESVVTTARLRNRSARPPVLAAQVRALLKLARALADEPRTVLQCLVDTARDLCDAGSAGISIQESENGQEIFRWRALAGALAGHDWGTMPRHFSPCGTVVDRDSAQLMTHLYKHFTYFEHVKPRIEEALLIPFHVQGRAVGTVWVVSHDPFRQFDAEDARLMASLAEFAGAAYQMLTSLDAVDAAHQRSEKLLIQVQQHNDALAAEVGERSKAQDALRDDNRHKDEFMAMLGHELRTPMAPIRHAVEMMRKSVKDCPTASRAHAILQRQTANMVRLIDDLLDVARIRLGKFELVRGPVALSDVLTNAIESARPMLQASHHQLIASLPKEAVYLDGDAMRLTQVFSNLLSNAVKYTPPGGTVWLSVRYDESEASVSVRDSGAGIAADRIGDIFKLFDQAGRSSVSSHGGLGIGLHLVTSITEMHGGTVQASSAGLGQGSEFNVRLPIMGIASTRESTATVDATEDRKRSKLRILLAEDNADAAMSLAALLEMSGHQVDIASDGEQAVHLAQSLRPEVILLDLGMPKLSGVEAARQIRQSDSGKSSVLVALTGWSPSEVAKRDHAGIFDAKLTKPVEFESVERLLYDLSATRHGVDLSS